MSRKHADPEASEKLAAELRAWHDRGGSISALAKASGVNRKTISGWISGGAPKVAVDWERVAKVIRASRPRA